MSILSRAVAASMAAWIATVPATRPAMASLLSVTPGSVARGGTATVTVAGTIAPADEVGAFDFAFNYGSSLSFTGPITVSSLLAGWSVVANQGAGSLAISISDYPTDTTPLDTHGAELPLFSFNLSPGPTAPASLLIAVAPVGPSGVPGEFQFNAASVPLAVTPGATAVPEPEMALILTGAVLAAAAFRRRLG